MYAIILDRNKQYFIENNSIIKVDFLNVKIGDIIKINKILFFNDNAINIIGKPFVLNTHVLFKVVDHVKDSKKLIIKFKRRKHHLKKMGHRQKYTILKMISIENNK